MPKTGFNTCKEIMEIIKSHGFEHEVPGIAIKQIIRENVGLDERTIDRYMKALLLFKFLTTKNHITFQINGKKTRKTKKRRK